MIFHIHRTAIKSETKGSREYLFRDDITGVNLLRSSRAYLLVKYALAF